MSAALTIRPCLDAATWDEAIWSLPRGNVFASWMWGAYKAQVGWTVTRLIVRDASDAPVALIQYQVKRRGFLRFVLVQGCPLLTEKGEKHAEAVVALFLDQLALGRWDLLAISFEHFQCDAIVLALLGHGFVPVQSAKYFTLELDLTQGTDPDLTTRFLTDLDERLAAFDAFWAMYGVLKAQKGFRDSLNGAAFRELVARDPHHRILEVREKGERILIRIAHVSGRRFTVSTRRRTIAPVPARPRRWRSGASSSRPMRRACRSSISAGSIRPGTGACSSSSMA
jgi:hypothetical protein